MPDAKLTRLIKKNLLYSIHTAVGSKLFRHIHVRDEEDNEFDTMKGGDLGCAYVVSALLTLQGLIDGPHSTVETTLKQMQQAGWEQTDKPLPGAVALWPKDADNHHHIGFYIDADTYMSNSSAKQSPVLHHATLHDGRRPIAYYTHPDIR